MSASTMVIQHVAQLLVLQCVALVRKLLAGSEFSSNAPRCPAVMRIDSMDTTAASLGLPLFRPVGMMMWKARPARLRSDVAGLASVCFVLAAVLVGSAAGQSYRVERIASDLNQPTYVTQAPGDPANILYFSERTSDTVPGFAAVNKMGKVWRYDVNTRTKELVLDLSNRLVVNDTGLQTIAFHPDFNNLGTPGYHKMYVTLSEAGPVLNMREPAINKLEEYTIGPDGTAAFDRILLEYNNNTENNHTIDWAGFDPTATGAERDYLYVSTGDGSFGNAYGGRPSQNPIDLKGKILRIDVNPTHADAYPSNVNKNFAIPPTNPFPVYNETHPPIVISRQPALEEIFATGVRNAYRMSFDRATGDLWMGDVGENFVEEVNFLKAGSNTTGPPVDFGWPQREGTVESNIVGAPHEQVNPYTDVTSLEPVQEYVHGVGFAAIGGYVYRGPIAELQGKYFFADFVFPGRTWMLDFDRDTDPALFNGFNGDLSEVTDLWQSLVYDSIDPTYENSFGVPGLDQIVSFGEDNLGNLYIVDFGFGTQYPGAGQGEIFRLTPTVPEPATWQLAMLLVASTAAVRRCDWPSFGAPE